MEPSSNNNNKKQKNKNPSPLGFEASISKRETARKKLVERDPDLLRVQDALEHIIVTGAKVRRDDWRRCEFKQKEENRSSRAAMECPPRNASSKSKPTTTIAATTTATARTSTSRNNITRKRKQDCPKATMVCHAEDLRIYGKRYNSHLPAFAPKSKNSKHQQVHQQRHQQRHQQFRRRSDDSEWNLEHGDSVPPILFRMARLSQEHPSEEQQQLSRFRRDPNTNNNNNNTLSKSFTSTDVTPDEQSIPRALIEKCWERAVHIASNASIAPVASAASRPTTTTTRHGSSSKNQASSASLPFNSSTPLGQQSCREKCESLGVDIQSLLRDDTRLSAQAAAAAATATATATTCPRCTRSFSTTEQLLDHFYGTTETIGCCRALIRPCHLDLVRNLLLGYAESQTDQLGAIFALSQQQEQAAAADRSSNNTDTDSMDDSKKGNRHQQEHQHLLDWRDVRRYFENAVERSTLIPTEGSASSLNHPRTVARHPVQQSMQIGGCGRRRTTTTTFDRNNDNDSYARSSGVMLPLMLNPMVLEAVNRRLIDRYADVPR